ncbi:hypothetical protein ACQ4PT_001384 [Festuca glaucescens]
MWVEFGIPAIVTLVHGHHHTLADWLGVPLMAANAYGIVAELIYVAIFLRFAVGNRQRTVISLVGIAFVSVTVLLLLLFTGWSRTFVGYIAMFSGVTMYAIPVYTTRVAYQNNDVTQISALQASASLANGVVPNFAAVICATGQLYVWLRLKVRAMQAADAAAALAEAVRRAAAQDLEAAKLVFTGVESGADDAVVGASRGIASQASESGAVRGVSAQATESGAGSVATGDGGAAQGMGGAGADKQVLIEMPKLGGGGGGNDDVENQVQQGAGENKDDGGGVGSAAVDKSEEDDAV